MRDRVDSLRNMIE